MTGGVCSLLPYDTDVYHYAIYIIFFISGFCPLPFLHFFLLILPPSGIEKSDGMAHITKHVLAFFKFIF